MELIEKYNGAVFFVDILGMSALTNKKIVLNEEDFAPWLRDLGVEYSNQFLGAAILSEFRSLLLDLSSKNKNIKVTQLSDCAFIWSENIADVIVFCSKFMHQAIDRGILCRGGMAFGEIIETNQSHKLGRFIVGDAVTKAAKLESVAKGCRVLITEEFPHDLFTHNEKFSNCIYQMFKPFKNPLDYSIYDEFKWYLAPELSYKRTIELGFIDFTTKVEHTKVRLKLANKLRLWDKFSWNAKSSEGKMQLRSSVSFLSENYQMDILHNFDWEDVVEKRVDFQGLSRMENIIQNYSDYRQYKRIEFPNDWAEY